MRIRAKTTKVFTCFANKVRLNYWICNHSFKKTLFAGAKTFDRRKREKTELR